MSLSRRQDLQVMQILLAPPPPASRLTTYIYNVPARVRPRPHPRTRASRVYPASAHAYTYRILGCYSAPGMSFFVLPFVLHFARIVISKITRYLKTSISRDLKNHSLSRHPVISKITRYLETSLSRDLEKNHSLSRHPESQFFA